MKNIKIVALDLDGTLFNSQSVVTDKTKEAIKKAMAAGVHVVISTGRPLSGIPFNKLEGLDIEYAITTNGSGVYYIPEKKPIYTNCMENELTFPIIEYLSGKKVHCDAFCDGGAVSTFACEQYIDDLILSDDLKYYLINTRHRVESIPKYITEKGTAIQKMTLNFPVNEKGEFEDRETVRLYLTSNPDLTVVCGGFNNLECTKAGVHKGVGLTRLAEYLNVPLEETMAIGDSENDLEIIKTAGLGVAMANSSDDILAIADIVTLSNDEDGIAYALEKYVL